MNEGNTAWLELSDGLERALRSLPANGFLILSVKPPPGTDRKSAPNYFVQFWQGGDMGLRAEAVSNRFLQPEHALGWDAGRRLTDLGWLPPDSTDERPTPNINFYREWAPPGKIREAVELGVTTLRDVFGVRSPLELEYQSSDENGHQLEHRDLPVEKAPLEREDLAQVMRRLEEALSAEPRHHSDQDSEDHSEPGYL